MFDEKKLLKEIKKYLSDEDIANEGEMIRELYKRLISKGILSETDDVIFIIIVITELLSSLSIVDILKVLTEIHNFYEEINYIEENNLITGYT